MTKEEWLKEFEKELRALNQSEEVIKQELEIEKSLKGVSSLTPKEWAEMVTM